MSHHPTNPLSDERDRVANDSDEAPPRVLVVEDDLGLRRLMEIGVRLQGFEVETADSGYQALELASSFRPQVMLIDLGLPDMSGYTLLEKLKDQPENHGVVYLAISGRSEPKDFYESEQAGFHAHYSKPLDLDKAGAVIRECLASADSQSAR